MSTSTRSHHGDEPSRWWSATSSLAVHALLIGLLITSFRAPQRGAPASNLPKSIQIVMAPPSPVPAPKVVVPPSLPTPKPPTPPKEIAKLVPAPTLLPTPVPAKPKTTPQPATKPQPAPAKPAGASTQTPTPAPPVPPVETPEESLIGRFRDNWLPPARRPRNFRCLIRIDYRAGGRIIGVEFLNKCGEYDLEESVRKAIWKSQPLSLIEAKTADGSIEIEFTP
ncbi:MAG: hypothetical protein C0434_16600 [Xanthomonadaceae bacterium]|nr:hypothetical protein [Xanthomonadaceae bacterium]